MNKTSNDRAGKDKVGKHGAGVTRTNDLELATADRWLNESPANGTVAKAARMFLGRVDVAYAPVAALIYGSRARGDHRPDSDADLAVVLAGRQGDRSMVGRAFSGIAFDILMETGIRIHALPLWEADLRRPDLFSNPALIANIEREGVRL